MATIPRVLQHLGWHLRPRNRGDCGLCFGSSRGTLAYREHVWHCHRCHAGGDVYSLVRAVNRCGFPEALRYVAELAGIRLEDRQNAELQRELDARKRQRERLESAADKLETLERELRLECRDRILRTERTLASLSGAITWTEQNWLSASICAATLWRDLAIYTLISFAAPSERARYCLYPELRDEIISDVRWAGYVRNADGKHIEVLA